MNSQEILEAIGRKYRKAAIVHEVVITDEGWKDNLHLRKRGDAFGFTRRIDALMFMGGSRTAIEVKVSRSDFRRDTEQKRSPWQRIVNRFVYATPPGLILPSELPSGCGLWEVGGGLVKSVVRCAVNRKPEPLPYQVTVALAYRAMRNDKTTNRSTK